MDGLVRAAISHLWFETLNPFADGNGRIGRAILQLALGQDMGQPGRYDDSQAGANFANFNAHGGVRSHRTGEAWSAQKTRCRALDSVLPSD